MTESVEPREHSARQVRLAQAGVALCLVGALIGAVGLFGWVAGVPWLTTMVHGQQSMKANTAVALVLLGVAASLRYRPGTWLRWVAAACALVVLGIGLGTLAEYALGLDLKIDQLLIADPAGPFPGRPSPPTAVALSLLAPALVLLDVRPRARARPSEWLALLAGFTAYVALLGLAFGVGPLYRFSWMSVSGVSLPTALSLLLITAGLLLLRPAAGVMRAVFSPGPGGALLRRFVPLVLFAPLLADFVVTELLKRLGSDDARFSFAVMIASMGVMGLLLLMLTAVRLDRVYEALVMSGARVSALFERAPDGIFVADLQGRYREVNEAGCRLLGFSRDELIGKTIVDLIPAEDVGRLWQEQQRMLEGAPLTTEWMLRRKDGALLPVEINASILPDGRWQAMVRDISERKRAQEKLREARERLDLALKGADLGTWDWNVQSGEVTFNARWAEMRGYRLDEVAPRVESWSGSIHPDDSARVQRAVDDYFQGRVATYEAEFRARTKSGAWIWILDRGKVFARDAQGRPIRMVGTELDITPRKWAEAELRRAIASRDDVLGIVAHDLRNPLNAILIQASRLRPRGREPERRSQQPAEAIVRAAQRMNRLIQDLLDVTRIEAGRLSIEQTRQRTGELISEAVEAQRALAAATSLELYVELQHDLPDVLADRERLLQVFENLIGNALKFTGAGGRITIGAAPRDTDVVFWVADTGCGLSAEQQSHLFDRFWQARSSGRTGAGLGLSIVKGLVEAHRGRIWVESTPGKGSTFFFTIPMAPRAEEWRPEPAAHGP